MSIKNLESYHKIFSDYLYENRFLQEPSSLYEPINYLIDIGGKRIRPALVLMAYHLYGSHIEKALPASLAVEYFHNFSLMHDDIMDNANLRRGQATVNDKYDVNTAILSGDALLIYCYKLFEKYDPVLLTKLISQFNKMSIEVCEGQRMDMDFETTDNVSIEEYLRMIEFKTSVLLACSLSMGATVADANETDILHLYEFGKNLGIAFQIQDDILDAFGDESKVGKKPGGDIIQNKKTYLYIKALELSQPDTTLYDLYHNDDFPEEEKVRKVKTIFTSSGALEYASQLRDVYNDLAISHANSLSITDEKKSMLIAFANSLVQREL